VVAVTGSSGRRRAEGGHHHPCGQELQSYKILEHQLSPRSECFSGTVPGWTTRSASCPVGPLCAWIFAPRLYNDRVGADAARFSEAYGGEFVRSGRLARGGGRLCVELRRGVFYAGRISSFP